MSEKAIYLLCAFELTDGTFHLKRESATMTERERGKQRQRYTDK